LFKPPKPIETLRRRIQAFACGHLRGVATWPATMNPIRGRLVDAFRTRDHPGLGRSGPLGGIDRQLDRQQDRRRPAVGHHPRHRGRWRLDLPSVRPYRRHRARIFTACWRRWSTRSRCWSCGTLSAASDRFAPGSKKKGGGERSATFSLSGAEKTQSPEIWVSFFSMAICFSSCAGYTNSCPAVRPG
jgi:hypothetical protein